MYTLLLLCVLLLFVSAIRFPGGCPKVPSTHTLKKMDPLILIYSIPFSCNKPSYLFREVNGSDIVSYRILFNRLESSGLYEIVKVNHLPPPQNICRSLVTKNDSSLALNSTIYIFPRTNLGCYNPFQEEIRVWFEGSFVFIWSCVETEDLMERNEAVIICSSAEISKYSTEDLRAVAEKYVSKELIHAIDLSHPANLWTEGNEDRLFTCPGESQSPTRMSTQKARELNRMNLFIPVFLFFCLMWTVCAWVVYLK